MSQQTTNQPARVWRKEGEVKKSLKPVLYSTYYPMLVDVANKYGYALAIHGSMLRDFDLIAVAWIPRPRSYKKMIKEMVRTVGWNLGMGITTNCKKPHGRIGYTIPMGSDLYLDISILPPHNHKD